MQWARPSHERQPHEVAGLNLGCAVSLVRREQLLVLRSEWGGTMLRSAVAMLAGYMSASYAFAGLDDIREQCKAQFPALFDVGAAAFVVAISKRSDAATALSPLITIPMPEEVYEMFERWERCS